MASEQAKILNDSQLRQLLPYAGSLIRSEMETRRASISPRPEQLRSRKPRQNNKPKH